jgi:hypothetical protein
VLSFCPFFKLTFCFCLLLHTFHSFSVHSQGIMGKGAI